jgi:Lipid A 3-O-deacylase (PagL)
MLESPPIHWICHSHILNLTLALGLSLLVCTVSFADDTALLSIGPRFGFSGKSPFLGKEQKHNFYLTDVAATFALPWSWSLGESRWRLETRLLTSAGVLSAANEHGLMATVIPGFALSGWDRFLSIDVGGGPGFFSRDKFGNQDFSGHVQIVGTAGIQINPLPHAYAGFRVQHFSDAGLYGSSSLGVDMYIVEAGYRF